MASRDWFPSTRGEMLTMAKNWNLQINSKGKRDWRMDDEEVAAFGEAFNNFETEMNRPMANRTVITNTNLKKATDNLTAIMRDTKRRFLHCPPLMETEIVSLGLKTKDTTPTPVGKPKVRPNLVIGRKGEATLDLSIKPAADISADKRPYYGCKVFYDLLDFNAPAPKSVNDFSPNSRMLFTRKQKEKLIFTTQDSGKKAYFFLRYENGKGEAGPWSNIFSAVIP